MKKLTFLLLCLWGTSIQAQHLGSLYYLWEYRPYTLTVKTENIFMSKEQEKFNLRQYHQELQQQQSKPSFDFTYLLYLNLKEYGQWQDIYLDQVPEYSKNLYSLLAWYYYNWQVEAQAQSLEVAPQAPQAVPATFDQAWLRRHLPDYLALSKTQLEPQVALASLYLLYFDLLLDPQTENFYTPVARKHYFALLEQAIKQALFQSFNQELSLAMVSLHTNPYLKKICRYAQQAQAYGYTFSIYPQQPQALRKLTQISQDITPPEYDHLLVKFKDGTYQSYDLSKFRVIEHSHFLKQDLVVRYHPEVEQVLKYLLQEQGLITSTEVKILEGRIQELTLADRQVIAQVINERLLKLTPKQE
ncbi:hypothetical protein [Psittacicella gerlachiana]|uniref:Uncharacterized protein n=1 Tax=Psittacicella gerlachiana TaxID=2028574 RepID=A0A3A1YC21_9GAMM|nr:hypothetical protein [Psittacicella gerlachiana]RIY33764.1 hypothetical protein CKF59_06200 [Psittacicella gerlachiana]